MATIQIREIGTSTWYDLPEPDFNGGYQVDWESVDADTTGRDETGFMHRDMVRAKVHKLNCKWSNRRMSDLTSILTRTLSPMFELKFLDADGTTQTGTFYVGSRSTPIYSKRAIDGNTTVVSMTANFIER